MATRVVTIISAMAAAANAWAWTRNFYAGATVWFSLLTIVLAAIVVTERQRGEQPGEGRSK